MRTNNSRAVLRFVLLTTLLFAVAVDPCRAQQAPSGGKARVVSADSANEQLLFVSAFAKGDGGGIWALTLNQETGDLRVKSKGPTLPQPFYLAADEGGERLYATAAPGGFGADVADGNSEQVIAFAIDRATGTLRELNRQASRGRASCYLDVTGSHVFVANYTSGDIAAFPLAADGTLSKASTFFRHQGSSVNPSRQKEPHAHCILASPNGQHVYAADLGTDDVFGYSVAPGGKLQPLDTAAAKMKPGSGPRHLAFHPNGRQLYVINELLNTITLLDYSPDTGKLTARQESSTLPQGYEGRTHTADVVLTSDGKFLYGTNRGHDSIACYRVAQDGALTLAEFQPSGGKGPQNLEVSVNGRFLVCANMPGNSVTLFRIDAQTGELAPVGDPLEIPMPSCIVTASPAK